MISRPSRPTRTRSRGQSLVEFALIVPIILFILLIAIDFGRVYLGYINLQNMTRIAANFAANHPKAWTAPGDPVVQGRYKDQILNDAKASNCVLPNAGGVPTIPAPVFSDQGGNGTTTDLGDVATVGLTCKFGIITPVISSILGSGGQLNVSASAVFPIKQGMGETGGVGGTGPTANFNGSPLSGNASLVVQFTDQSTGSPTNWAWDFNNDGNVDDTTQNPTFTYTAQGTYSVSLTVGNATGSNTKTRLGYISVGAPAGAINFTASPVSGTSPLTVQFTDTSTATATAWAWDFNNDGTVDDTTQNPSHVYTTAGTYSVKLTITTSGGPLSKTIIDMISVSTPLCTVPDFGGTSTSSAQATWSAARFTTQVQFKQGNLPWTIQSQSIVGLSQVACGSTIRVSKNNQP